MFKIKIVLTHFVMEIRLEEISIKSVLLKFAIEYEKSVRHIK